jgi:hypothetical protein
VALAVKTPWPLLLLSGVGLVVAIRRSGWRRSSVLWAPPLLFLSLGLSGVLTIGYRHILPVVPFLILMAGYTATTLVGLSPPGSVRRLAMAGLVLMLGWHVVGSLRLFPHQEAFFNELAGGWYNWSNLLVDSNLDWGQDLPALRQAMDKQGIEQINLAYFGKAVPEVYGVRYRPLYGYLRFVEGIELSAYNPYTPEPGWYAISATSLRLGLHQADTVDLYAYFRSRRPDARAGYSIYLYHLVDPPGLPVERRIVAGEPVYRLTPEALGVEPGRRVQVKWVQAADVTVYPLGAGFAPPADGSYEPVTANFGDVLTLLGFRREAERVPPGQTARLTLYWQVGSTPMPMPAPAKGAPLAAFVHATTPDNPEAKLAQFDGWPVALRGLERGDVITQPVALDIPQEASLGEYDLLVGLYSPQSATRLPVLGGVEGADFVRLGPLRIEGE